jgi:hypothetical protein
VPGVARLRPQSHRRHRLVTRDLFHQSSTGKTAVRTYFLRGRRRRLREIVPAQSVVAINGLVRTRSKPLWQLPSKTSTAFFADSTGFWRSPRKLSRDEAQTVCVVGSNTFTTTSIRCTARCLAIGSQDPESATYETSILNAQLASITQRLKRPFDVRAAMRRKSWKYNATTSGAVSSHTRMDISTSFQHPDRTLRDPITPTRPRFATHSQKLEG